MASPLRGSLPRIFASISTPLITTRALLLSPRMVEEVSKIGYTFPYLQDETQQVARAFQAACTPDFFLYDREHKLIYRGQYDGSRPESGKPVTGADLRAALDAVLAGKPVSVEQRPSVGCNVKWKAA